MIEAKVICDSISPQGHRLLTYGPLIYPKFIHGEFMTHRALSRNASSSRAIPVRKMIDEVRSDILRAGPVYWGAEQKGMQSGEELSDVDWCDKIKYYDFERTQKGERGYSSREIAQRLWADGAEMAAPACYFLQTCFARHAALTSDHTLSSLDDFGTGKVTPDCSSTSLTVVKNLSSGTVFATAACG
jgi:hypothetical protein